MKTRNLAVKLTREEREIRASQLVEEITARNTLELEAKSSAKTYKNKLDDQDTKVRDLHRVLRTNTEYRDVEVYEIPRPGAGMVDIYRTDTNKVVDTREMTETERQVVLFPAPTLQAAQ